MSSHASTQDKSPDPGQALNVERKKTKVLKQALKQERKERVTLEQEFEKQKEQITDLNTQLQDKVSSQRVYFLGIFRYKSAAFARLYLLSADCTTVSNSLVLSHFIGEALLRPLLRENDARRDADPGERY